ADLLPKIRAEVYMSIAIFERSPFLSQAREDVKKTATKRRQFCSWRVGHPKFAETILDLSLLVGVPHPL
ncbi:MAG: hypothetical protein WBE10_12320, partial [Candidatus Acidiferrum sp.]